MIAILMSNVDDARQLKLVRALRRHGYPATVVAFARDDYYRADAASAADVAVLGVLANESYLTRVPVYLRSVPRLRRYLAEAEVVIVFSSEHALLARMATALRSPSPRIVREFGDVPRAVDGTGWKAALARSIERRGLRHCNAVLVTAEGFVEGYLRSRMDYLGAVAVLPNKPDLSRRPDSTWSAPENAGRLKILYPGLIRCQRSVEILLALADAAPDTISISVCGYNLTGMEIAERENLRFLGPYRSPDDLGRLYGGCHVVYSGYPYEPDRSNYSLARTIRFHESVTFGRPQIAHKGTADAVVVGDQELGIVIDPADSGAAAGEIVSVPVKSWERYAANARRLADQWSTYDDDLVAAIVQLKGTLKID